MTNKEIVINYAEYDSLDQLQEQDRLLLCCDGFRHQVSPEEIYRGLNQQAAPTRQEMEQGLRYLVDLNKQRNEVDNITAILIEVHS